MATTTLKLYNTKLNIRRNMVLDDIDAYLNALPSTYKRVINDFQYIKIEKELDIKLNMIKDYKNFRFNYVSIQEGNITYYFYIIKYSYEASDTIRLHLVMDALNFMYTQFGFNFTNETFVIREHRDRFFNDDTQTFLYRKVDNVNEELYPTLVNTQGIQNLRRDATYGNSEKWDMKWYVLIESTNLNDKCGSYIHLIPQYDLIVKSVITYDEVYGTTPTDVLVAGIDKYPTNREEASKIIECPYCPFEFTYSGLQTISDNNTQKFNYGGGLLSSHPLPAGTYMSITPTIQMFISNLYKTNGRDLSITDLWGIGFNTCIAICFNDKTAITKLFGVFDLVNLFKYSYNGMRISKTTLHDTDSFNKLCESKLYHSSFFNDKYMYRNMNFYVKNENITSIKDTSSFDIYYAQGSSSGEGLFYLELTDTSYIKEEDSLFYTYSANNEYPLINDEYLNYIRNGYQYDKSQRDWGLVSNILGMGTNLLGGSIGALTGNTKATSKGLMSAATGGIKTAVDYAKANESIEHNKKSAMMQGINVMNNNDLYLNDMYNGQLGLVEYRLKSIDEDNLFNLFRLRGYKTNCYKIPDLTTRRNYNYIECYPFFEDETDSMLTNFIDDIKQKFEEGITLYHKCSGSFMYDLEEQYENYEVFLKPRNEA